MNKKILWVLFIMIVVSGIFFLIANQLGLLLIGKESAEEKRQREKIEQYNESYFGAYEEIVTKDYFSFPEESIVSFGEIKDLPGQIGKYENSAKDKEAILVIEYNDANGQKREAYVKSLELELENILYVLRHFTNYFDTSNLSEIEYRFKFSIDAFKKEEYKRETNSGIILNSNNRIFVIMSNEDSIEPFLDIFKSNNKVDGTFLEYLMNNPDIQVQIENTIKITEQKEQQFAQKVPEKLKTFAKIFWQSWITLNTEELKQYYADQVWFFAGDEWFEEWNMDYDDDDEVHEFVNIEKNRLLDAYTEIKQEDFDEDFEGMQKLTDSIMFYRANDFMNLCYAEDKVDFFNHFNIIEGDFIMVVRLDGGETCTTEGNFLGGELRFFVMRSVGDTYKVFTDFTE